MIGRHLSHFEILEEIGAGGMGVVYKARDLNLHRLVAIKILPQAASDEPRRRFLEEARTASHLNHPGVVTIHEVDSAEGIDFIAMEFVEGESLARRLTRGPLESDQAQRYATAMTEALIAAHAAGIIHRDLKPANVMITVDDRVKILDFGLAKRSPAANPTSSDDQPTVADPVQTAAGTLLGTPAYMSPEQAKGRTVDPRTDLFSLGAICSEMLTGKRAFPGENPIEVLSAILHHTPKLPSQEIKGLPRTWDGIVKRLLQKTPQQRYPDAEAVLRDLQNLSIRRRRWQRAVLAAGSLVLVTVALAWWAARIPDVSPVAADADVTDTFPDFRFRLLSDFPGSHRAPSLSPDGSMVAFVTEDENDIAQIWVLNVNGGRPIQITFADTDANHPRWSPRNDRIVFWRQPAGLWQVPPLGGQERQILDHGYHPAVSPDGDRIAFVSGRRPWIAAADGSNAQPLAGFEKRFFGAFTHLEFGPNGQNLALFLPHEMRPLGDIWRVPLDGGEPVQLTDISFVPWSSSPIWSSGGRWIVFTSGHAGSVNLWRVDAQRGGDPVPVTRGAGSDYSPSISADGQRLVYSNGRNMAQLKRFDIATGELSTAYERRNLIIYPNLSPDGKEVAFFASVPEGVHILVVNLTSGQLRQVTHGQGGMNTAPRWSADGKSIYYQQQKPTYSYRRISASGAVDELLVEGWVFLVQNGPVPSPDERSVAYALMDSGRIVESRLMDFETGEEQTLPRALNGLLWALDGQTLWGDTVDSNGIYRCSIPLVECREITKGSDPRLSQDGSKLYFLRQPGPTVWERDLSSGTERALHRMPGIDLSDFGYGVTPEGQVIYHQQNSGRRDLWLGEAGSSG